MLAFQSDSRALISHHTYLLPIEFEGRTVRYGPSLFRSDLWHKREVCGKNEVPQLNVRTEKNKVSKIFIISLDSNRREKYFNSSGTAIDDYRASNPKHENISLASNKN